jgi:glutathione S-transferase
MKPTLHVGNRNYSSWSLRPWLVLTWGNIDFDTQVIQLGGPGYTLRQIPEVLAVSPAGTVPAMRIGDEVVADSLAISEWAAEQVPSLWPADSIARAQARAAVCEMHSGFAALRAGLPCNIRRRAEPRELNAAVRRDVERIDAIWSALRGRFGGAGPYLFGESPSIADAFFAPVATRFRTYAVKTSPTSQRYVDAILSEPAFRRWELEAIGETWTMPQWDAA